MQNLPSPDYVPIAVAVIALVGAVIGVIGQQAVDIWKTAKQHRQELQRRMFDVRFKTATEVTVLLHTAARFVRARLAEAEEWTRADERYDKAVMRLRSARGSLPHAFRNSQRDPLR